MFRQTISFTAPQTLYLKHEAQRLGVSVAEIVRRTIDAYNDERSRARDAYNDERSNVTRHNYTSTSENADE
jgi:hypothetical protein